MKKKALVEEKYLMDAKLRVYLSASISRLALTSGIMVGFAPKERLDEAIRYVEGNKRFWNEVEAFLKEAP